MLPIFSHLLILGCRLCLKGRITTRQLISLPSYQRNAIAHRFPALDPADDVEVSLAQRLCSGRLQYRVNQMVSIGQLIFQIRALLSIRESSPFAIVQLFSTVCLSLFLSLSMYLSIYVCFYLSIS